MLKFDIVSWFVALDLATPDYTHIIKVAGNYIFKVNNRNIRTRCEICSKLTIKAPEKFIDVGLVSLLLTWHMFHPLFECFYC